MVNGIVKWYSAMKGYGFCTSGEGDVFIHYKNILGEGFKCLYEGDEIEFDIESTPKGNQAKNIRLIKKANCIPENSTYSEQLKKEIERND